MVDAAARHRVAPGSAPDLAGRSAADTGPFGAEEDAERTFKNLLSDLARLQYLLFADHGRSLIIVLQGLDAAGKDGVIRHVLTAMNPQGVRVCPFKQPSAQEAAHDFLWRAHKVAPGRGEVAVFNRSHYEDVLVVRVRELVPEDAWRMRYDQINDFEALLAANGTQILKFFLHISPQEQLERFAKRLENPAKQWKISNSDYSERKLWGQYMEAYEEALARTSTEIAPWYVIPSDHKWYRDYAVAQIIATALEDMKLSTPGVSVDLDDIRKRYHAAVNASR